jgi:tetratricopeptide (TPR) repeat protein
LHYVATAEPVGARAVHLQMQKPLSAAAPLKSARLSFSRGEVESARETCLHILAAYPNEPGALHLLGLMAHRDGDAVNARDFLRRAAESPQASALYLLTFADLCCKAVDRLAAVELARRATELDAALPLGWFYLGNLLFEMRRFEESGRCLNRAVELDGAFWQAQAGLAVVLGRTGEAAKAGDRFESLLDEHADNAEIIGSFAVFLSDQGRYTEALIQAERAIVLAPEKLDHHLRAAEIELLQGHHPAALDRLAVVENAWPREIRLLTLKANLLRSIDRCDESVALCRDAVREGLESADLLRAFGLALHLIGEDAEALAVFDRAAAADPALVLSDKGVLLSHIGRLADARAAFEEALTYEPALADAWYNQSNIKTYSRADPDIDAMERLLVRCSYQDRLLLHFALGKAYMDIGGTDWAFAHWHEGNRMKRAVIDYDGNASARQMDMISAMTPDPDISETAADARFSEVPVFIVGMPRCGSSLIEQILASHPNIHGAGELVQLRALFESAESQARPIAEAALEKLRRFSPQAARIIDKDLCNFLHLGVIHRVFPHARIIHCRRDPLDTCFSAYTKLFAGDFAYTYEQRELGTYYRRYHALMAHWRSQLPGRVFMEVDYEALVSDPQRESCRLLDFLGLPWNEGCGRFFETSRSVNTASFAQVRRPIYRSSVGSALSLRPHLQPLIEALGDLAPVD